MQFGYLLLRKQLQIFSLKFKGLQNDWHDIRQYLFLISLQYLKGYIKMVEHK